MSMFDWLLDKLGYVRKVEVKPEVKPVEYTAWPFPVIDAPKPTKKKPVAKKAAKKPAVAAKTARTKKAK